MTPFQIILGGKDSRWRWPKRLAIIGLAVLGVMLLRGWLHPTLEFRGLTPTEWRDAWQADAEACNKAFLDSANTNLAFLGAALRTPPSLADRALSVLNRGGRVVQRGIPISLIVCVPVPANRHLEVQSRALVRVEQMGSAAGPVVPVLIELLNDQNAFIRAKTLRVIGSLGDPALAAVPCLIRLTEDADAWTRGAALAQLHRLDPGNPEVRAVAVKCLKDPSFSVQLQAGELLWAGDLPAGLLLPMLAEIMKHGHGPERGRAVIFIGQFGKAAAPMVPALISLLADRDPQVRLEAAGALGKLGSVAAEAMPALEALRERTDAQMRLAVLRSIQDIRGASARQDYPQQKP